MLIKISSNRIEPMIRHLIGKKDEKR